jgi:hypothetical protein
MIMDIKINQNNDGTFIGELHCKFIDEPFIFNEFVDMIVMVETIFDTKSFPERQLLPRTFSKRNKRIKRDELDLSKVAKERSVSKGDGPSAIQFVANEAPAEEPSPLIAEGLSPYNFELSVRFRRKAEWQGILLWREKGIKNHFSSIVELSRLLNVALSL